MAISWWVIRVLFIQMIDHKILTLILEDLHHETIL